MPRPASPELFFPIIKTWVQAGFFLANFQFYFLLSDVFIIVSSLSSLLVMLILLFRLKSMARYTR